MADTLCIPMPDIHPSSSLINDLGADSLDLANTVMAIEDRFDINITEAQAAQMTTVADVVAHLEGL